MSAAQKTRASFAMAAKQIERLRIRTGDPKVSGLRIIGEEIMTDVKASRPGKGVPVDTGALRSSGRVEGPSAGKVTLSFGGAAAPYALTVHENLQAFHPVGEARYLVRGLDRWRGNGESVRRAFAELKTALKDVCRGAKQ